MLDAPYQVGVLSSGTKSSREHLDLLFQPGESDDLESGHIKDYAMPCEAGEFAVITIVTAGFMRV